MTETWLRALDDSVEIGTLCPTGYRAIHIPSYHMARTVPRAFTVKLLGKCLYEGRMH